MEKTKSLFGYAVNKCIPENKISRELGNATDKPNVIDRFPYYGNTKEVCVGKNKNGEYILMSAGSTGRVVFTSGSLFGKFKDLVAGVTRVSMISVTNFRDFEPIKQAILSRK